jgi:hypothetical protein
MAYGMRCAGCSPEEVAAAVMGRGDGVPACVQVCGAGCSCGGWLSNWLHVTWHRQPRWADRVPKPLDNERTHLVRSITPCTALLTASKPAHPAPPPPPHNRPHPSQVWDGSPLLRSSLLEAFHDGRLSPGQLHAAHLSALSQLSPEAGEALLKVRGAGERRPAACESAAHFCACCLGAGICDADTSGWTTIAASVARQPVA